MVKMLRCPLNPQSCNVTVGLSESAVQARVACLIPGSPIDRSCGEDDASPRAGAFFPYVPLDFVHEFAGPLHSQRPETSLCRCLLAFLSENTHGRPLEISELPRKITLRNLIVISTMFEHNLFCITTATTDSHQDQDYALDESPKL